MRVTSMAAGLAFALAACGGGEKKADNQSTAAPEQQQSAAPAPAAEQSAGGGANHDVTMELVGSTYKFDPSDITIKAGEFEARRKRA